MLIIRKDNLDKAPEGFRKYVEDHFKKRVLVGVDVYMASIQMDWNHEDHEAYRRGVMRGIAPLTRNMRPGIYDEGMEPGQRLEEWVSAHPELVEQIYVAGEREDYGNDD